LAFACLFFWGCSYGLAGDESFFFFFAWAPSLLFHTANHRLA
jgi:hypothetical protein